MKQGIITILIFIQVIFVYGQEVYQRDSLIKDTDQVQFSKLSHKSSINVIPESKSIKYTRFAKEVLSNAKIAEVGDVYHDFEAFNEKGEKIKFSKIESEYILLDFTMVYCHACVKSISELREIDKIYGDSLTIISFSVDERKDYWLESIKSDSVSWISLWDGKGRFSETYVKYGLTGFPTFFLIDPDGKIIDKWCGYYNGVFYDKIKRFIDVGNRILPHN